MPQPAGPHDAEAFVGRSHELAVLSAALRQATTGDARLADAAGPPAAVLGQLLPEPGPARDPAGSGPGARLTLFEAVCTVRRQVAWLADAKAATGDNTPGAEEILATAAALGPGIDPALVAAALGIPAGPVARLCDDATAIGLLIRQPGRDLAALDLVQLAAAAGPVAAAAEDGLHDASGAGADEVLDQQARTAYRQRLTALDEELAEAEAWHDTERASRLRAEKDFLVRELAAATHLDRSVRTGTRCSYSPPDHPS
jgi:hypothetical protein